MLSNFTTHLELNFVFFELTDDANIDAADVAAVMKERGIVMIAYPSDPKKFRLVTHYWINRESVETVLTVLEEILQ